MAKPAETVLGFVRPGLEAVGFEGEDTALMPALPLALADTTFTGLLFSVPGTFLLTAGTLSAINV